MWLDLARYADSAGYADDPPRTIWAYRDWVIQAINENKPFDQFTIEQIAGDLLPNPTDEQLIATAFHRNTLTNNEGGTQDEEFRNVAVVDRVNTTMAVWMGTTMACAQCHNHKYDPISQQEYFQLFAILNNTQDADRSDEAPVLAIYTDQQRQSAGGVAGPHRRCCKQFSARPPTCWCRDRRYWSRCEAACMPCSRKRRCRSSANWPANRRETRLAVSGQLSRQRPRGPTGIAGRFSYCRGRRAARPAGLARWLVDKENPLTARVIANRYWETLFGRGIVSTSEDFGSQGEPPTHPELLDWLAVEFMDSGWDTRALIRTMVTSAVYRQSSQITGDAAKVDPDNRWLARGPRVRLSAEMVRDQALAVSGLLSNKMYGPPVRPPQPNLGLTAAFGSSTDWETSAGDDRYRRALYTTWRRSNPYPSMATFDAPNREVCTLRRTCHEHASAIARDVERSGLRRGRPGLGSPSHPARRPLEEQIAYAFRRCALAPAACRRTAIACEPVPRCRTLRLAGRPEAAMKLATVPLGELPAGIDAADAAAMTVVGNVLLNLDEMFLKR